MEASIHIKESSCYYWEGEELISKNIFNGWSENLCRYGSQWHHWARTAQAKMTNWNVHHLHLSVLSTAGNPVELFDVSIYPKWKVSQHILKETRRVPFPKTKLTEQLTLILHRRNTFEKYILWCIYLYIHSSIHSFIYLLTHSLTTCVYLFCFGHPFCHQFSW